MEENLLEDEIEHNSLSVNHTTKNNINVIDKLSLFVKD